MVIKDTKVEIRFACSYEDQDEIIKEFQRLLRKFRNRNILIPGEIVYEAKPRADSIRYLNLDWNNPNKQ